MTNLIESPNQKRIFIYTDPKELLVSSPMKEQQIIGTGGGGSSTTSNSRRSSLSLGMEIVGAQVTGAPAIVSSIPSNGLIKQFGVDIGEGDEILSVNGHYLRNRSDLEIDRIIGESAIESQGELELLVVKQSKGNHSPTICTDDRVMGGEETASSSDAQLNESLMAPNRECANKSRVVSSSSSSLASNSSSSTNGPRQMRANSHHNPEVMLNNIQENETDYDDFNGLRRKSAYVGKPINPVCYGEGKY